MMLYTRVLFFRHFLTKYQVALRYRENYCRIETQYRILSSVKQTGFACLLYTVLMQTGDPQE